MTNDVCNIDLMKILFPITILWSPLPFNGSKFPLSYHSTVGRVDNRSGTVRLQNMVKFSPDIGTLGTTTRASIRLLELAIEIKKNKINASQNVLKADYTPSFCSQLTCSGRAVLKLTCK